MLLLSRCISEFAGHENRFGPGGVEVSYRVGFAIVRRCVAG